MGRAGQRAFVVEKGMEGFSYPHLAQKMGLRANETAELLFEDCFVPLENLLGGEALYEQTNSGQSGFSTAMKTFDSTRPIVARSEEHTSELQSRGHLVCRLLLE